jgi:hypothetical protein
VIISKSEFVTDKMRNSDAFDYIVCRAGSTGSRRPQSPFRECLRRYARLSNGDRRKDIGPRRSWRSGVPARCPKLRVDASDTARLS